ncbi:hypothetical protein GCM10011513_32810 [Franconibacter daqui]|nr:hypothetical protein GCM10011513_32810 [Franconibacter daqui]
MQTHRQLLTSLSQYDFTRGTVKQPHASLHLQFLNAMTNSGLAQPYLAAGTAKAARLRDGDKNTKLA